VGCSSFQGAYPAGLWLTGTCAGGGLRGGAYIDGRVNKGQECDLFTARGG